MDKEKRAISGKLSIVGIGPGAPSLRTAAAEKAILTADFIVGYRPYLDLIADLLPGKRIASSGMGKEVDRAKAAVDLLEEGSVALVSSGDPNIYAMAGLGLELAPRPGDVEVVPGVTSFTAAACHAGLAFRECVAVISLSDLLTPWQDIEARLKEVSELQMPVALYNPRSKRRNWQLLRALEICGERDVLVAREVGRPGEEIFWTSSGSLLEDEELQNRIDMATMVIISGKGAFRGEASSEAGINLVGIGPGDRKDLTREAESLLKGSQRIYGAQRYLKLLGDISSAEESTCSGPWPERMASRFREADELARIGKRACILTGGDPSIFSSGWRVQELAKGRSQVHISPGVSAFTSVAARAGAPLVSDFVLLSRPLDPFRHSLLARSGLATVTYNVQGHEIAPILEHVDQTRPCVLARDVARPGEELIILKAGELLEAKPSGFRFTLLIASDHSYIKDGRIIAKRGYETKYSY
jgi:precorrin-3B C17-methyltransferase